jgi:hypothetical protein
MTPQEFAQKIKAKYPTYQNVDDLELTQKVIAKYPVYASQVKIPEAPKKDLLQKTGDVVNKIFPGEKLGEALANSVSGIKGLVTGDKQQFKEASKANEQMMGQVIGDVANIVATAGGVAGAGTSGGVISKALKTTGLGAVMAGGKEAAEGGGIGDVAKSAAAGALTGAAVSGALSGIEKAAQGVRTLPERLIRSATGQSKKEILAGKSLEKFVLENKKVGTADALIKQSKDEMDRLSEVINSNLKSVPVTKAKITTASLLEDIVRDVNAQGGAITKTEAKEIIERLAPQAKGLLAKPSMSLVTANKLRQSIDRTVGDRGFLTAELPFNKDILRSFTNALREEVKSKAPEGTRAAFNSLANEIRLTNALTNKIAQGSRNQIISFGDLIGGGLGGIVGGLPGAAAGAAARRVVQSTPFLTGSAVAIDSLDKTLSPIISQLEPSVQTAIIAAIRDALIDRTSSENASRP